MTQNAIPHRRRRYQDYCPDDEILDGLDFPTSAKFAPTDGQKAFNREYINGGPAIVMFRLFPFLAVGEFLRDSVLLFIPLLLTVFPSSNPFICVYLTLHFL